MKQNNIYIDTNIALDLLSQRESFCNSAGQLFTLADKKKIKLYISSLSFSTIHYILSKQIGKEKAKETLRNFKVLTTVLSVDDKIIDLALNSYFPDFEDAIQYYCAIENNIKIIITRNIKDYKRSQISVMTAEDFLKM